jgi:hypothetical protein
VAANRVADSLTEEKRIQTQAHERLFASEWSMRSPPDGVKVRERNLGIFQSKHTLRKALNLIAFRQRKTPAVARRGLSEPSESLDQKLR